MLKPPPEGGGFNPTQTCDNKESILLQRKTEGYPIERYVGRVGLIGGVCSQEADSTPRQAAFNQIDEELKSPELKDEIATNLEFFSCIDMEVPSKHSGISDTRVKCFVYIADVSKPFESFDTRLTQGDSTIQNISYIDDEFSWGHEVIVNDFIFENNLVENINHPDTVNYTVLSRDEPEFLPTKEPGMEEMVSP